MPRVNGWPSMSPDARRSAKNATQDLNWLMENALKSLSGKSMKTLTVSKETKMVNVADAPTEPISMKKESVLQYQTTVRNGIMKPELVHAVTSDTTWSRETVFWHEPNPMIILKSLYI